MLLPEGEEITVTDEGPAALTLTDGTSDPSDSLALVIALLLGTNGCRCSLETVLRRLTAFFFGAFPPFFPAVRRGRMDIERRE